MDFWKHQGEARRKTIRLILLYALGLFILSFLLSLPITILWGQSYPYPENSGFYFYTRLGLSQLGVAAVIVVCSIFAPGLRTGGSGVAESMGGALVMPMSENIYERRLLNLVEELSLASGLPVPQVYILEGDGINAFAAGTSIRDAVIGVTRGALEGLKRDELQAVIAHEFSHIQNGDMRLNLRFIRLLFGLVCMANLGAALFRLGTTARRPQKDSGAKAIILILSLGCFLFGKLGGILGKILQAAINRQREFLADASAVQFTRSTALAGALKRIGALRASPALEGASPSLYSHLFFCRISDGLFSTHPPLEERIRRIDPAWDGVFPSPLPPKAEEEILAELKPEPGPVPAIATAAARLQDACRSPLDAACLIFALILDDDPSVREKQFTAISSPHNRKAILEYKKDLDLASRELYVPLIASAAPALRMFSEPQYLAFKKIMLHFIDGDGVFSFREWILYQIVSSEAGAQYDVWRGPAMPLDEAAALLLSLVARLDPDEDRAGEAYAAGCRAMGLTAMPMPERAAPERLDAGIRALAGSGSAGKRAAFLRGARAVIMYDGVITEEEDVFLRMLSVCLDGPALNSENYP